MIDKQQYTALKPDNAGYFFALLVLVALVAVGAWSALTMEHAGHHITGMTNHIVWGLPHVFAITLIVAASGALNGASLSSVFGVRTWKRWSRISVVLAMALLIGGLLVLVLDLGRPDRLIVAMTTYNFRSIFAWNIFLYTGFLAIGALYLWMMSERRFNRFTSRAGGLAFTWRIILTTGTGSIFGFLIGRDALDSALLAPMFITLSLVLGTAALALVLTLIASWQSQPLPTDVLESLRRLLFWFLIALVYFTIVHHLTNLYVTEHREVEIFTLKGPLSVIFWLGHIVIGVVVPLIMLSRRSADHGRYYGFHGLLGASLLAIIGSGMLVYVVVIGAQSTPQRMFPGKTVLASSFGDAGFSAYTPSGWEWGLGIGGIALAVLLCTLALRVLPFTPDPD